MIYEKLVVLGLIVLLMGTFCLGRVFSIFSFGTIGGLPLYVTDVFIIFSLPFSFSAIKYVFQLPKRFFVPYFLMLIMGLVYLGSEIYFFNNAFAWRGVVLSAYLLFVPILLKIFHDFRKWDHVFIGIIAGNTVGVIIGWYMAQHSWKLFDEVFTVQARGFNFTLFYCLSFAFLWAYGMECKPRVGIVGAVFLAALNLYLIFVFAVRSSWIACLALMAFYGIIFFRQWKRAVIFLLTVVIIVMGMMHLQNILNKRISFNPEKVAGLGYFVKKHFVSQRISQDLVVSTVISSREPEGPVVSHLSDNSVVAVLQPAQPVSAPKGYENIQWRISVWRKAWQEMRSTLFFGKGLGAVLPYDGDIQYKKISGFTKDSGVVPLHNEILTILYKMGGVGLLLFLWINGFVFVTGCRMVNGVSGFKRVILAGMLGGFVVWHVMAQFFDLIDSPPTNIFLWVMMGCILALSARKDKTTVNIA